MPPSPAWFSSTRATFVGAATESVVAQLASGATREGWLVEPEQHDEWTSSVEALKHELAADAWPAEGQQGGAAKAETVDTLRAALAQAGLESFRHVILEYNMRRRGLRVDCVLLGEGIIAVIEFKRSRPSAADRDQVMNYAVNLCEFHAETQRALDQGAILVPIVVATQQDTPLRLGQAFHAAPWSRVLQAPLEGSARDLAQALRHALALRPSSATPVTIDRDTWLAAKFSPSSTILDAAISLYGAHDVSAISEHAAPIEVLEACATEAMAQIEDALQTGQRRIVFVSGAPGAGKTLVGLKLAFSAQLREQSVFVTGNAPLVDVLCHALQGSYKRASRRAGISGYAKEQARHVLGNATFKIVKAHNYLGDRGRHLDTAQERVVIFDEAQRTYEKGRTVLRQRLANHEADLILESLEQSFPGGTVVVALLGHNQAINSGERGAVAWLEAAARRHWQFAIGEETLALTELASHSHHGTHALRRSLQRGHLAHSLRYYRNASVERWAHAVLENQPTTARKIAAELDAHGHTVYLTRSLAHAKRWAQERRVGAERAGVIASAQGRRLSAVGIHVQYKPDISDWMLTPSGDVRSSNMLETAQNQYQIQGLELDHTIVCWDLDLRRSPQGWQAFKMQGTTWKCDKAQDIARNGYLVLLTRARKGMILVVPEGDEGDPTRPPGAYGELAAYLRACGAEEGGP
ncbi:MAG: DUF2075 domain-containing protein [Myxococcales bacterium]|nr:DUF2075 domain-containing protein [Myxococcales bacterium]